uniref:M23ase beta-sheet core domain-containing protein n=1 Tax=candidate division WWE3 bacterium TaxID=2053526 RepID=A0A831Z0Q3_UNCKA
MAIFQNVFGFFLPNSRRRRRAAVGGGGPSTDPALGRVLEGIDDVLEGVNAPARVGEFIKSDLEDAFTAKSAKLPGYAPGVPAPVKISTFQLISDPVRTAIKAIGSTFKTEWKDLVPISDVISEEIDAAIWKYLYNRVWVAPDGTSVVPLSTQQAIKRWNSRKGTGVDVLRKLAARAVEENPGVVLMMGRELQRYAAFANLPPTLAGYRFGDILKDAQWHQDVLARTLVEADKLAKAGNLRRANDLWDYADKIQKDFKTSSEPYRAELFRQFDVLVRRGSPLADTQAGQFWRFWKARNLHYSTLNFLKTYQKGGVWGVVKAYGWDRVKNFVKYSKATDWVSAKILGPLGLNKVVQALSNAQQVFKRLRNKLTKDVLKKLIEKLGLKSVLAWIGAAIGSIILPGAGTTAGAIISAVAQFAVEYILSKLGSIFKLVAYAVAGSFAVFILGAIAIVTLIAIVLSNTLYPWEQGGSAAAAQRFVRIEIGACESATECAASGYQNPLRVSNGRHPISWRVVIRNISSATLTGSEFTFSQAQCTDSEVSGFDLAPGAEQVVICSSEFTETDEVVSNTISFASSEPAANEEAVGIVIFGNPPVTLPTGWPVANGCITQGPDGSYSHGGTEAIDIGSVSTGTAVRATFNGVVQRACWEPGEGGCDSDGYGNYVRVSSLDGNFSAVFAHLASISVGDGDRVTVGQQLGTVNNTGNSSGTHLHYEFRGLPMSEPYIPQDTGSNGSIRGCSEDCGLCF